MPKKRNKTQKEVCEKMMESSKDKMKKELRSSTGEEKTDSNIPNYFPASSDQTTNVGTSSTSCNEVLIPKITTPGNTADPEKDRTEETVSEKQESVAKVNNTDTTLTSSKEIQPEESLEQEDRTDTKIRHLKQTLLSPKRDSDSDPSKTKRKTRTKTSKGNKTEAKQPNITDHFVIRRSQRKCKSIIEEEQQKTLEDAVLKGIEEGIEIRNVEGKGRGVFAIKPFKRGDFICEYYGDHIDYNTAKEREKKYSEDENIGCYMYYFSFKNKKYCVDATQESGRLGRLLNHSVNGNCTTKLISIKENPYLILVAAKDIKAGSELLYDYGERNKEAIASHPWLQA